MSADFWAGYISGAAGILIGNPLDLVKTRLQAGSTASTSTASPTTAPPPNFRQHFDRAGTLVKGTAAPLLTYGALNALLFVTYNRTLALLSFTPDTSSPPIPSLTHVYLAGATSGLTTFLISAPTELLKVRAQTASSPSLSTWHIARSVWEREGIRGLYHGGGVTAVRDAVGYAWYFWTYEATLRSLSAEGDTRTQGAVKVLLSGGLAGVVTWASVFPLDVVKTRVQAQVLHGTRAGGEGETAALLGQAGQGSRHVGEKRLGTLEVARRAYQVEGMSVFFRGLGVCSVRAFIVNAVQWTVYEWTMRLLRQP